MTVSPNSTAQIALAVPDLRGREHEYLSKCILDNWVSSAGPFVEQFERKMADSTGCDFAVAVVNGTAALSLALTAAGVKRGDHVIVPDYTFAATANSVIHAGGVPHFVDVTANTWTIDPNAVEQVLRKNTRVSAVVAVHTLGHPADVDPLRKLCSDHGVLLFEDAAGAIGASYKGRPAGSLGDLAVFSFNGNKTVTAGGGGMIVTNNEEWANNAKSVSQQGRFGDRYHYQTVGFNYRLTNVNAAIGLAQLERLEEMLMSKRQIAARYDAALRNFNDLQPMPRASWAQSGCWLYSVLCDSRDSADELVAVMTNAGIQARHFWEGLSAQPPYVSYEHEDAKVSASLSGRVVSLPCSSHLTQREQDSVIDTLTAWRGTKS